VSEIRTVISSTQISTYIFKKNANDLLVAISEHADAIKVELESREVREDRVREAYGWDNIELGACLLISDRRNEIARA
jgi:hypothetical protein